MNYRVECILLSVFYKCQSSKLERKDCGVVITPFRQGELKADFKAELAGLRFIVLSSSGDSGDRLFGFETDF